MALTYRVHYIAATASALDILTDDINSTFIFDPLTIIPELSNAKVWTVLP